ncbi:MAG: GNAT family N-acetyltransferase [Sedimenticolaceae bacterium]|nr:GNAT family N-acetyltransferase [Sedimenticolaceae bacterium]
MTSSDYRVELVNWQDASGELSAIRRLVFMDEQGVPAELEWDGLDTTATHAKATSLAGETIGTARLLPDGQIGRMAVLAQWRGIGVGTAMLQRLIAHAPVRERLFLNAQTSAESFYRRNGFEAEGEIFTEAGIPHIRMRYRPSR